jgi:hypothetical protein
MPGAALISVLSHGWSAILTSRGRARGHAFAPQQVVEHRRPATERFPLGGATHVFGRMP